MQRRANTVLPPEHPNETGTRATHSEKIRRRRTLAYSFSNSEEKDYALLPSSSRTVPPLSWARDPQGQDQHDCKTSSNLPHFPAFKRVSHAALTPAVPAFQQERLSFTHQTSSTPHLCLAIIQICAAGPTTQMPARIGVWMKHR